MKTATSALAFLTLAALSSACAQDLTAYRALAQQLDAASAGAGKDALATLKRLDAAQTALDKLKPSMANQALATNLQDTMNAVRAAQARTPAELQAQVHLARGLMRKSLYDQTMTLLTSNPTNGTAQLDLLAREFGMTSAALLPDLKAGKLNLVAWRIQKNAVNKMTLALNNVAAERSGTAYLRLARAASWFPVLQDAASHLQPPLSAAGFTQALGQVASGDVTGLGQSLKALRTGAQALSASLTNPPPAVVGEAVPVTNAGQGAQSPQKQAQEKVPPVVPADQAIIKDTPAPAKAQPLAAGTANVYGHLGRALVAAQRTELDDARAELTQVNLALAATPASLRQQAGYDALVRHVQELSARQALRPVDVQALMAEWAALEKNRPMSMLGSAALGSARFLNGPLRVLLALLLALACAAPLYLLHLAFGNKNPYWRAISLALMVLLLPTLADGLFGVLGWLGDSLNMPALRGLLSLTPEQSALSVPLRLLGSALALGLATYGFRGLCQQFGLLGSKTSKSSKSSRGAKTARPAVTKPKDPDQTSFDWDEEV